MFLRRFVTALRQQDWTTTTVEFLIVVAGIFVGLQVDDGNQARKDHIREIEYLQRIDSELTQDIGSYEDGVSAANTRLQDAELILSVLADPAIAPSQPTAFLRALVRAGFTFSPLVSDHTFEEIKSAGELSIIRDVSLRMSITQYYHRVRENGQWDYLREMTQTEYLKRQAGILNSSQFNDFWADRDGREVTPEEAIIVLDKLTSRSEFIEWIPITISGQKWSRSKNDALKESAENLRKNIATFLEK